MSEKNTSKRWAQLAVQIDPADKRRLMAEAFARVERGEAPRVDTSAIVRDLVAAHLRKTTERGSVS